MIDQIKQSFLKAINTDIPEVFQPSMEWTPLQDEKRRELLLTIKKNTFENTLKNFFRNQKLTRGIWNIPTAVHTIEFQTLEMKDFKELEVPEIGNPLSSSVGIYCEDGIGRVVMEHKANVTFGTIRFNLFANKTLTMLENIDRPIVIELGGGYGGYAHSLLKKQKNILYINLDLPELLPLSSYYLMTAYPNKKTLLFDEYKPEIDVTDYDMVFLPNWEITNIKKDFADIFVNFRSMGEMKKETITEYLIQINRILKNGHYFYQENTGIHMPINSRGYTDTPLLNYVYPVTLAPKSISLSPCHDNLRYWEAVFEKRDLPKYKPIFLANKISGFSPEKLNITL